MTPPAPTWVYRTCPTCEHTGRYGSDKLADFHFGRHSCELVVKRREQAARQAAKLASGGTVRPCTHKLVHHEHGDRVRYVLDQCRCHTCKVAQRNYEQARRREVAYGRLRHVDASPVRKHVRALMKQGMGIKRIAEVAGVANSVIGLLIYGRSGSKPEDVRPPKRKLQKGTAAKILAVQLDLAQGAVETGPGTPRRLQALVTIGWSQTKLARELGVTVTNLNKLIHGHQKPTRSTADAIRSLYDRLWNQLPPRTDHRDLIAYNRSRGYALARGWAPPMAWDDDTIDLARAKPQHQRGTRVADERAVA